MLQFALPFKYEEETKSSGLTGLAGLPLYLELLYILNIFKTMRVHLDAGISEKAVWKPSEIVQSLILLNLAGGEHVKDIFGFFKEQMEKKGIITRSGSLVDASFVEAPKQRNSRSENELIKSGEVPEEWKKSTHKLRQKDTDARWTKKNKENHYGYKNHVKVDKSSKLIVSYTVTDASVHDSQKIVELVDKKDQELCADSAYVGKELHQQIRAKNEDIKLKIHEKGYRNHPLTQEQKNSNREKSRIRARVEHVFGHMTQSMGGLIVRSIGICRARCTVGLQNLAYYNLRRYKYLRASGGVKAPA